MRAPTDRPRRLLGVDVARGLALVGMGATHIFPSFDADGDLHVAYQIGAGRAAALFAVLAGVGLALASGGTRPERGRPLRAARAGVVVRAALLLVLGLLLSRVESPPLVILSYYGLLFLVAVPFLGLTVRPLAALALAAAVTTPIVSHLLRAPMVAADVAEPGEPSLFVDLLLMGTYPVLTWTAYLFVGLAVGRADLRRLAVAVRLLVIGLVTALLAKAASSLLLDAVGGRAALRDTAEGLSRSVDDSLAAGMFGVTPAGDWRWLTVSAPHSGTTLDLLHTIGTSLGVLGACLLLVRLLPRAVMVPLAAAGSMTLTLYTAHVLALADGSPFLAQDRRTLWLVHVATALAVATLWRTFVGRGPLEAVAAVADRGARRAAGGRSRSIGSRS